MKTFFTLVLLNFIAFSFYGQEEYSGYEDKNRLPCESKNSIYLYKLSRDSSDLSIIKYEAIHIKNDLLIESASYKCIEECDSLEIFHKLRNERLVLKHGKCEEWYDNGNKKYEGYYIEGLVDREKEFNSWTKDGEPIYSNVDKYPEFPGGLDELRKYLGNNIVYPSKARAKGIEENIYVQFMVDKKGKIKNVHTVVGQNKVLIDAAIKVIEDMPKWVPGEKDGKKINVWYIIPINYKLN